GLPLPRGGAVGGEARLAGAVGAAGRASFCRPGEACADCGDGDAGAAGLLGAPFPAAAAAVLGSSPSSASTAISSLTGTSCVPSGTTIFASTPSSIASYSMVALSVSISAITSPALTLSPSFLSHLERLPFSIVGDSAGMRMLTGIASISARAGIGRRVHLGIEDGANARERLFLGEFALGRIDARDMARHVGDQHAPGLRVVESATQRNMQAAIDDSGAQHFDAALLQRGRWDQ